MGQTLTHGVYLPDEGERNCYSGLAANWQLLDNAVGTIAEHTSALSEKAPLVHTHTKSDITDFPAYGNAAGTICEGNDSRLSDARTPVAHTHGKADITDLLNSNFIPSANNSYNLGSSSYQWKSVYAQSYYYNGTAWGLDQRNSWTNDNCFKNPNYALGQTPTVTSGRYLLFTDYYNQNLGWVHHRISNTGVSSTEISAFNKFTNSQLDTNGTIQNAILKLGINSDASTFLQIAATDIVPWPGQTNENLGTSSYKWKTLNGINPGALSLPDVTDGDPIDTNNWSLTGGRNSYTPTENGWFFIRVEGTGVCKLNIHLGSTNNDCPTWSNWNQDTYTVLTVPAVQGVKLYIYITADLIKYCKFYPCLGNV